MIKLKELLERVVEKYKDSNFYFVWEYEDLKVFSLKYFVEILELDNNKLKNWYVNILLCKLVYLRCISIV